MKKIEQSQLSEIRFVSWVSGLIVVVMTPWINLDSLIIPKLILLFCSAMYLLPNLTLKLRFLEKGLTFKLLLALSLLFLTQMFVVLILSSAPFEQQIFGRSGRGLGLLTYGSVVIFMLITAASSTIYSVNLLQSVILYCGSATAAYSILQNFNVDIFQWNTKTNGIIGTLGNPNFQSSFAAAALLPSFFYLTKNGKKFLGAPVLLLSLFVIYIANSTQGYIILISSLIIFILNYLWFRSKNLFRGVFLSFLVLIGFVIAGMLNRGPLSYYLYKVSITSRGEFWRTAVSMISDNLIFGVGIDSFGDWSQFYKDSKTINGINEYTDNAHNYFLEFAATGGIPLAILYFAILLLTFVVYLKYQKRSEKFNPGFTTLFIFWFGLQTQSLISPGSIALIVWSFVLSGFIIGVHNNFSVKNLKYEMSKQYLRPISYFLVLVSMIFTYPLFNADRLTLQTFKTKDGLLAVRAATMFPESTVRYGRIGTELVQSQLWPQALAVGRAGSEFNPNSVSAWLMILANPTAPIDERRHAQRMVLKLDPLNQEIRGIELK